MEKREALRILYDCPLIQHEMAHCTVMLCSIAQGEMEEITCKERLMRINGCVSVGMISQKIIGQMGLRIGYSEGIKFT